MIFRGDVWHAGCGYALQHWRLHEYWQPEGTDDGLRADGDPPRVGWRRLDLCVHSPLTRAIESCVHQLTLHGLELGAKDGGTWDPSLVTADPTEAFSTYVGPAYDGLQQLLTALADGRCVM